MKIPLEEHKKVERLLSILNYLSSNIGYSLKELSERVGVSERTVQRYIRSFNKAGYIVEKHNNYYKLAKNISQNREISNLLHFSEEEACMLYDAIESIEGNTHVHTNLRNKLLALYDSDRINYPIVANDSTGKIKLIIEAIKNKQQVVLKKYKSSNSLSVSDRIVEPFSFTTNYQHLWAFEPCFKNNYMYRVSRIKEVDVLDEKWHFEYAHKTGITDVFRMVGNSKTDFTLKLNVKAFNYLIEQYPLANENIKKLNENTFSFSSWFANLEGISRFILSVMDDVEVISPKLLKDYLNEKLENKKF